MLARTGIFQPGLLLYENSLQKTLEETKDEDARRFKRGVYCEAKANDRRAGARNSRVCGAAERHQRDSALDRKITGGRPVGDGYDCRECRTIVRRR